MAYGNNAPYGRTPYGNAPTGVHAASAVGVATSSGVAELAVIPASLQGLGAASSSGVAEAIIPQVLVSAVGAATSSGLANAVRLMAAAALGSAVSSGLANLHLAKPIEAFGGSFSTGFANGKITFQWAPPVLYEELIAPAEIRVIVVDRLGNWIAEVEDAVVENIKWVLNGEGEASIRIDPLAVGADEVQLLKRELQVWMDNDLVWWGVPWRRSGLQSLTYACSGLWSLFTKRFIDRSTMFYTSIDQLAIAWDLLRYAQDNTVQANRDLRIASAAFSASGHQRSRNYERTEHANIKALVEEFTKLDDGFDFDIRVFGDGRREWTPYYPKKGVVRDEFRLEFTIDGERGITGLDYTEDAVNITTEAYVTGGSEGDVKFEENYEDVAASVEYGVMQNFISEGSQKDVGWLLERAEREVNVNKRPKVVPVVHAANVPLRLLGQIETGDWIPLTINYGSVQENTHYRIRAITWNPGDRLRLEFVEQN